MPTLQVLRRACQDALDDRLLCTVYASATFTVSLAQIASTASNLSASRYNGRWICHITSTGTGVQQRTVQKDSYVPSTGLLGIQPGWGAPPVNDQVEMTSLFPCETGGFVGETTYRNLINAALRMLVIPDRYALTISTSGSYSLPSWLREDRLVGVLEPSPISGGIPVDASWRRPRMVADAQGNVLTLDVPLLTASGSLHLDVLRPADSVIAPQATGVYTDSTVGLVNEGDQAKVETEEVVAVFLSKAYQALMNRGDNATWRPKWETQLGVARGMAHYDRSLESAQEQAVPDRMAA